jgi:TolA-binding protein
MPMAKHAKKEKASGKTTKPAAPKSRRLKDADPAGGLPANYWKACELVRDGEYKKARQAYARLERSAAKGNARVRNLIQNDLAVIAAKLAQDGPLRPEGLIIKSRLKLLQNRLDEARAALETAAAEYPDDRLTLFPIVKGPLERPRAS